MSELPSTSTITPPPARSTKTGSVVPTPRATAAVRRAISSGDFGPGIAVTRRRSWGRSGKAGGSIATESVMTTRYCDEFARESRLRRRNPQNVGPITKDDRRVRTARGAQSVRPVAGRGARLGHPRAGRGGRGHGLRRPGGRRCHACPRAGRSAGPRLRPAGRARRRGRPADHGRERQAADLVADRGGPGGVDLPVGGRGGPAVERGAAAAGHRRRGDRPDGARTALPSRPGPRHLAVQLPAQPGRPQGRAGHRGRRADRGQAGAQDAAVGAAARRAPRGDRPARRVPSGARGPQRGGAGAGRRPAAAGGVVHRLGAGRGASARRSRTST